MLNWIKSDVFLRGLGGCRLLMPLFVGHLQHLYTVTLGTMEIYGMNALSLAFLFKIW